MEARTHLMFFGLTGHGSSFFNLFCATLREAKNKLKVNLERHDVLSASERLEQKAREVALEKVGATPSDIPDMDLVDLERALAHTLDSGEGVYWTLRELPHAEFDEIQDCCQRNSEFRLQPYRVETRRIRNFQVVEE